MGWSGGVKRDPSRQREYLLDEWIGEYLAHGTELSDGHRITVELGVC